MSIETIYIQAKSKAAANRALAEGATLRGNVYHFMGDVRTVNAADMPIGTVVKFFTKYVGGNPYAAAYGNIARDKAGRLVIK